MTGGKAYKVLSKRPNYGNASWTIDLYVYVVIGSYNIVANTTPLKLGMYLVTPGSAYDVDWGDIYGSYLGISEYQGGAEQKNAFSKGVTGGGTIWIAENKSVTVSHASDGTAKAVPIQWKFGVYSDWGGYTNPSGGFTIELPTIPRVSDVSTTSTGVIGSALTISINRKSSAFTHTLKYKFKGASGTIVSGTSATSISWTPPMSLCTQIPNANSESCTITCETYSGSTLIGTSECSIRLSVPSSVQLTLSSGWAAVSPYNTGTAASGISKYVQGYSKAEVTFDKSKISTGDSYGAGISSFQVLFGGKSIVSTPYRTPVLSTAGTMNLECQVTDTRGRTQSVVLSVLVQPYTQPLLSDVSVFRCNAAGEADDAGTFISVYAKPNYSTVDGENTAALTVRYKTEGGSYGSALQIAGETTSVIGDGLVMVEQSYLVEITITDTIGNKNLVTVQIPTERVFFEGYRDESNGAAFGKHVTLPDYLDLEWNLRTRKNLVVDGATTLATALGIGSGGTGAATAEEARLNLGAAEVDHKHGADDLNPGGLYTDWALLTLDSAFQEYNGNDSYKPRYKAYGNIVTVRGVVSPKSEFTSSASLITMASGLPEALRPKIQLSFICQGSGFNRWQCIIGTDGTISMSRYGITAAAAVPTSAWLTFCCTYIV